MTHCGTKLKHAACGAASAVSVYQAKPAVGFSCEQATDLKGMPAPLCLAAPSSVDATPLQSTCSCQKPYLLWQVSILNFLHYNVRGGGDSALYGVEPATFYLRNGLNNLNLVLPLALAYPVVAVLHLLRVTGEQFDPFPQGLPNMMQMPHLRND